MKELFEECSLEIISLGEDVIRTSGIDLGETDGPVIGGDISDYL